MSIINQMLKDLEDRKESAIKGQDSIISRHKSGTTKSHTPLILLSLLSTGLLVVVFYLLWQPHTDLIDDQPVIVVPAASKDATTTIASLIHEDQDKSPKPAPSATTDQPQNGVGPAAITPVVIQPKPRNRKEVPATPTRVSPSPLQRVSINHLSPAELKGSWKPQRVTIIGKNFTPNSQVLLCWPAKCVTLKGYRVNYLSPSELYIEFTTGIKEERWHLTVLNPNGQASNAIEFNVRSPAGSTTSREPKEIAVEDDRDKFEGVRKKVIPLTAYQQAEAYYLEANQSLLDPAKALSLWERATLLAPEHHASRQALVDQLMSAGRLVEAEGYISQALKLFPNYPIYHQRLAQIRVSQGDHRGAVALIEEAIGQGVSSAELYAYIATLYQRDRKFEQSIENYQRALTLKPDNGTWWMGLGITYEQSGQFSESLSAYRQALNSGTLSKKLKNYVEGQIAQNQRRLRADPSN